MVEQSLVGRYGSLGAHDDGSLRLIENDSFVNELNGVRLDAVLVSRYPSTTRAFVREAIAGGSVRVNGRQIAKGAKLRGGETILVESLAEANDNVVQPNKDVHVKYVYEDEWLLGCDKPTGLSVQPLKHSETTTLMNGVVARHPECVALGDRPLMAGALHRIDGDTSGLVLVARTAEAFEGLRHQFAEQTVEKTYLALVEGSVAVGGTLEDWLEHDRRLPYCKMTKSPQQKDGGMHAVTKFEPVRALPCGSEERTLLKVTIFTGVTHQIRAQLAMAGMHIINDRLYGAFAVEGFEGHALHALAAKFKHPITGEEMEIRTPYPKWAL